MTGLVALLLVAVAVVAVLYPLSRPALGGRPRPERDPLEEEKEGLYGTLREIDGDLARGELTVADHAALRARYEARAAAVVARLERAPARPVPGADSEGSAPSRPAARLPAWLPWAAGSAVFLAGIFLAVSGHLMLRLPGETTVTAGSPDDPERLALARLGELREAAAARPGDAALQIELGRLAFALDDLDTAASAFLAAIQSDPGNAEANARLGKVLYFGGLPAEAARLLDRALMLDPDQPVALYFRAFLALEWEGSPARAIALWERYAEVATSPEMRAGAISLIERARAALAAPEEGGRRP